MIKNGIKGIIVGAVTYIVSFLLALVVGTCWFCWMYALFNKIWPDLPMWD